MGAEDGAASRTVQVRGRDFEVDPDFVSSWKALGLLRRFNSEEVDTFGKLDLAFQLIECATGVTEDEVVEMAGGEDAPAVDVISLATEIVVAINPKN